ncbi:MAG: DUF2202 domain-containing protein [Chloroflexi bacterium]|nr:DUF2202 domain-containing protein [Chloroflexota bacterium]
MRTGTLLFVVSLSIAAVLLIGLVWVGGVEAGTRTPFFFPMILSHTSSAPTLTPEEVEGILYMREEEKLARDVYLTLYDTWNTPIFQNISRSEQQHMDMVKSLIDRYHLSDPAEGNDIGEFTNQTLQQLYDQLVAKGKTSLADAFYVGATIEEVDIVDLLERLEQTDKADIVQVYNSLKCGSGNHLRAYVSQWEHLTGQTYEPQYLSEELYQEIMSGQQGGCGGH